MKKFQDVKVGDEIQFINSDGNLENALVKTVTDKKFTVIVLRYSNHDGWYDLVLNFFLSGKKTNRNYTYGDAKSIVCK